MKKEETITLNKRDVAKLWRALNEWTFPAEYKVTLHNDGKDHIRGAFAIVDSLIDFKDVKKYKPR